MTKKGMFFKEMLKLHKSFMFNSVTCIESNLVFKLNMKRIYPLTFNTTVNPNFIRLFYDVSFLRNTKKRTDVDDSTLENTTINTTSIENNKSTNLNNILPSEFTPKIIELLDSELDENFIKGGGPGGQKINKSVSCVQLKHIPTGIVIRTQRFRDLQSNRKEARKLLKLALDDHFNGEYSKRNLKKKEELKKKARAKAKSRKKYESLKKLKEELKQE